MDLIVTSNPNSINKSAVKMSLFKKCHHDTVYGKIDFKIPILPPYMGKVWEYKNTNTESIQRSISSTEWDFLFRGKPINKKVDILKECLKNIFHNFVSIKIIKCDYRKPPWMTDSIKINWMNVQDYLRNNGIIWSNLAYFLSLDAHEKNLPSKKVFIFSYISGNGIFWY